MALFGALKIRNLLMQPNLVKKLVLSVSLYNTEEIVSQINRYPYISSIFTKMKMSTSQT